MLEFLNYLGAVLQNISLKLKNNSVWIFLILFLLLVDQVSKILVDSYVDPYTVYVSFFGDFFRIIHAKNMGILFSIGDSWQGFFKFFLFKLLPTAFIVFLFVSLLKEKNKFLKLAYSLIIAGGIGNILDRFLRADGVIDFLDFKFYGFFGLERWPTFNFADSFAICGIIVYIIFEIFKFKKTKKR